MKNARKGAKDDLGDLRAAVKNVKETLLQSHRALAEIEARLAWSNSRQIEPLDAAFPRNSKRPTR